MRKIPKTIKCDKCKEEIKPHEFKMLFCSTCGLVNLEWNGNDPLKTLNDKVLDLLEEFKLIKLQISKIKEKLKIK